MNLSVALRLGRVSNVPTIWTNVLAGVVLAQGDLRISRVVTLCFAMSAFYVGGMFLNDAFDARHDQWERPERPIPSGAVTARAVSAWGYALLAIGFSAIALQGGFFDGQLRWEPLLSAAALASFIVYYDADHKQNPLSPLIMGLCRAGVYVTAGFATAPEPDPTVFVGALAVLSYVVGLTYLAKRESYRTLRHTWPLILLFLPLFLPSAFIEATPGVGWTWLFLFGLIVWTLVSLSSLRQSPPGIRQAVVALIAGISWLDAVFIATLGKPGLALLALLAFALTVALQRFIPAS